MRKNDETEELIKIFVTSIKTAEKKPRLGVVECSVLGVCFFIRCWNNLRSGATSLFDVGCSMFDVGRSSFKTTPYSINATCERLQDNLVLMGLGAGDLRDEL